MFGNNYYDRFNYNGNAGLGFGCNSAQIRVENACTSPVDVQLITDPNLQVSASTLTLQPNDNQQISIFAGYRIGKYDGGLNVHSSLLNIIVHD